MVFSSKAYALILRKRFYFQLNLWVTYCSGALMGLWIICFVLPIKDGRNSFSCVGEQHSWFIYMISPEHIFWLWLVFKNVKSATQVHEISLTFSGIFLRMWQFLRYHHVCPICYLNNTIVSNSGKEWNPQRVLTSFSYLLLMWFLSTRGWPY